jgi:alkylation response protein AidB-like acyl-CoA dehydrogenase
VTTDAHRALRRRVRDVVAASGMTPFALCDAWMRGHDPAFTARLAEAGLVGLSWPAELGGRDATHTDRLVVTEELLRVGAPVAAHWIADRQIGPAIMRLGSDRLQREILPGIASGEVTFCLGMSEPESGSDLAKVRTRAVADGDTFRLTGRKIWTSHAHRASHAYVLARTGGGDDPHEGLTELVVDMSSEGVSVRPIRDLAGEHHFNETVFDDVVVPAHHVIGTVGGGWAQVTEQLAFERGGMERVLSTYPLLARLIDDEGGDATGDPADTAAIGELVARLHTLRAMAFGVASAMAAGEAPVRQAAMLKHLGTTFEGDVVEAARDRFGGSPAPGAAGLEGLLAGGIVSTPGSTLRGGATEVLLSIIGKAELPPAGRSRPADPRGDVRSLADDVLAGRDRQDDPAADDTLWPLVAGLGWPGVGVPESAGGSGGDIADLAEIVTSLAAHGHAAPVAETALVGRALAAAGRTSDPTAPATLAVDEPCRAGPDGRITGRLGGVPWARSAAHLLVRVDGPSGPSLALVATAAEGVTRTPGANLAGEPRDAVVLDGVIAETVGDADAVARVRRELAVLQCAAIVGAAESAVASAREHVRVREQFGRPLAAFQAVAHTVARMAADLQAARTAVADAVAAAGDETDDGHRAVAARVVTARTATAVARQAHQLLGAMGITHEHDLHVSTLRLWSWRDEHGSARSLARELGRAALAAGEPAVWDWITHDTDRLGTTTAWRAS